MGQLDKAAQMNLNTGVNMSPFEFGFYSVVIERFKKYTAEVTIVHQVVLKRKHPFTYFAFLKKETK